MFFISLWKLLKPTFVFVIDVCHSTGKSAIVTFMLLIGMYSTHVCVVTFSGEI